MGRRVPYSKPGRGSLEFEIFGMAGVPEGIGPSSASVATSEISRSLCPQNYRLLGLRKSKINIILCAFILWEVHDAIQGRGVQ